jgi:adenylylsulfate reductase, subunit B
MPPVINPDDCTRCGKCVDVCQMDVFFGSENSDLPDVCYPEECWHCNACVIECPVKAIRLRIPLPAMAFYP